MASEKLIAFILKARQNKRNDGQTAQQLLSVGWKQEAITDAFSEIKSQKTAPAAPQAAKMAQAPSMQQPAPAGPQWVKPTAAPVPAQTSAPPQQSAPAAQPQPSSAPYGEAPSAQPQSAPFPAQQAPAVHPPAQTPPVIPAPLPVPASPIPPASPIQLPPRKESFLSSLFGKKQPPLPLQMAAPDMKPAASAAGLPDQGQSTIQPSMQGQSTLATFAGASGASSHSAQQPPPSASPAPTAQAPPLPSPARATTPAGMMKLLPIIAFVMILAAAGAYYVFVVMPAASTPQAPAQPSAPPIQNITLANPARAASGPIDCGTGMDCFIRASSACEPAKMTGTSSSDFLGMLVSGSTYMEIGGTSESGKCPLYMSTSGMSVKFSDAMVAAALAKGIPIDDIKKQEADAAKQANATIGLNGTCMFNAGALSALLAKWKAGGFSTSDLAGADCSGKMFEVPNPNSGFSAILAPSNPAPPANTTSIKANASAPSISKTNSTGAAKAAEAKPIASAIPAANASKAANASGASGFPPFAYSHKYTTYYPEHLVWFCGDRGTEFYRMHWTEYFGGDCSVEKPKEGYANLSDYAATGCTMVPCCINGPYNEYSRSYDYFECGYN